MIRIARSKERKGGLPAGFISGLARVIVGRQRKWADYLQENSERLSPTGKKVCLAAFILVFGGISIYTAVKSATTPAPRRDDMVTEGITVGGQRQSPAQLRIPGQVTVSRSEYSTFLHFQRYVDSLSMTEAGRAARDSLLRGRPGLMDSIRELEQQYLEQR